MSIMQIMGNEARQAAKQLAIAMTEGKNAALAAIAEILSLKKDDILAANASDIAAAKQAGLKPSFIERLTIGEKTINGMIAGIEELIAAHDPIGRELGGRLMPNGLNIQKLSVPLGVIGIIYESRPNVTVDAACLCLKAGNAVILKGGEEAARSNALLCELMQQALYRVGLPANAVQLFPDSSIEGSKALMQAKDCIDVLIPRGSKRLIKAVVDNAHVPVIETGAGNCHIYIDAAADSEIAVRVADNAKNSRPSVCNATETLLIHSARAGELLPKIKQAMDAYHTELRGCERTRAILGESIKPATDDDYATEYNDYILAVRVVDSLDEAIEHIGRYGTGHSEAIITEDYEAKCRFTSLIDAAAVYVNASTRFTDGGCFGLGAEIGISTQKMHARGPMGLEALTSYKYVVHGDGQIR